MLNVTGLNHFYYVHDFIDMRCKHSRVLSIIRKRLHKEPSDGDVFIVMSRNRTFSKISLMGAGITLTWFLTKFFGYQPMLNFQRGMP